MIVSLENELEAWNTGIKTGIPVFFLKYRYFSISGDLYQYIDIHDY